MFIFIISNPTLFFVFTPHFTNFKNWVSLVIGEATGGISCVQGGVLWRIFHHTLVYCVLGLLLKNVFVGAVGEVLIMLSGGMSALLMQPMTLPPPAEPWPPHGSFHSPSLSGLWWGPQPTLDFLFDNIVFQPLLHLSFTCSWWT